jgi:hypothetical protein
MRSTARATRTASEVKRVNLVTLALPEQHVDLLWLCVRHARKTLQNHEGDPCEDLQQLERFLMRSES